jgi:hypothetical protein
LDDDEQHDNNEPANDGKDANDEPDNEDEAPNNDEAAENPAHKENEEAAQEGNADALEGMDIAHPKGNKAPIISDNEEEDDDTEDDNSSKSAGVADDSNDELNRDVEMCDPDAEMSNPIDNTGVGEIGHPETTGVACDTIAGVPTPDKNTKINLHRNESQIRYTEQARWASSTQATRLQPPVC